MEDRAAWIWPKGAGCDDEYAEFLIPVRSDGGEIALCIACDGLFELYGGGRLLAFGKYPDFPHARVLDRRTLRLPAGETVLGLRVWHIGVPSQCYCPGRAAAKFWVEQAGSVLFASGATTQGRLSPTYRNHRCEAITPQLGLGFFYDATREPQGPFGGEYGRCEVLALPDALLPRPIRELGMGELRPGVPAAVSSFRLRGGQTAAQRIQRAVLTASEGTMSEDARSKSYTVAATAGDGVSVVLDLGREEVGFLSLSFETDEACLVEIGYGEHLDGGRPRTELGARNFAVGYMAKRGRNEYINAMRRLGLRYLILFFHTARVTVRAVGIVPVGYPLAEKERSFADPLHRALWETSVRTLTLCMHDHYEDSPWREQCLYALDARNQMLAGLAAFENPEFARASLVLLARGLRADGLLPLCAPAGVDLPIPFFSLVYPLAVAEYAESTGDGTVFAEIGPACVTILKTFAARVDGATSLIPSFGGPPYWDFYEWTEGMSGDDPSDMVPSFDAPLNAMFVIAATRYAAAAGENDGLADVLQAAERVRTAARAFCDEESGLYQTYLGKRPGHISALTNALVLTAGIEKEGERIAEALAHDACPVGASLSHSVFVYDALLSYDFARYRPVVLRSLEARWGKMLPSTSGMGGPDDVSRRAWRENGTFWETDAGADAFEGAGSLCHGWSALPAYFLPRLLP